MARFLQGCPIESSPRGLFSCPRHCLVWYASALRVVFFIIIFIYGKAKKAHILIRWVVDKSVDCDGRTGKEREVLGEYYLVRDPLLFVLQ